MIALRPFTREDWFGLAGAECFADGSEPQIGELLVDGDACTVVLDATGLVVLVEDPEGRTAEFAFRFGEKPLGVARALDALRPEMALDDLLDLGFDLDGLS
jgi:hypothetical protein